MENKVSAHVIIAGRVQGVFFRMETKRAAEHCGVRGWVRNQTDGTVEALFEGDSADVDSVIEWCKKGPPLSKVENVDVTWKEYSGDFEGFKIAF